MHKKIATLFLVLSSALLAQQPAWLQQWNDPTTNIYDVVREFDAAFEGMATEKGKGWKQFKRWEAFMDPRVYPSGQRPNPTSLSMGMEQIQQSWGSTSTGASGIGSRRFHRLRSQPAGSLEWKPHRTARSLARRPG